jgi:hypothetical protein
MRMTRALTGLAKLTALALPLLLGAGCNTFKYFDIHVSFDPLTLDSTQSKLVSVCKVTVSGADSTNFTLKDTVCPNHGTVAPLEVGVFEYSSFADSGTMNFKLEAFTGLGEKPECILGTGTAAVAITSATTLTGDLVIKKTGMACTAVTPPTDGST